jgi:hypothetical protein
MLTLTSLVVVSDREQTRPLQKQILFLVSNALVIVCTFYSAPQLKHLLLKEHDRLLSVVERLPVLILLIEDGALIELVQSVVFVLHVDGAWGHSLLRFFKDAGARLSFGQCREFHL